MSQDDDPKHKVPYYSYSISFYLSAISCGVRELAGVSYTNVEKAYKDLIHHCKSSYASGSTPFYQRKENALPAMTFLWSDRAEGNGDRLAELICMKFPDNPPLRHSGINPASGQEISVFMWTPVLAQLMLSKEWLEMDVGKPKQRHLQDNLPRMIVGTGDEAALNKVPWGNLVREEVKQA